MVFKINEISLLLVVGGKHMDVYDTKLMKDLRNADKECCFFYDLSNIPEILKLPVEFVTKHIFHFRVRPRYVKKNLRCNFIIYSNISVF